MRGDKIGVFVVCVGIAITMLGGMGWFDLVGVEPDGSNIEQDQVESNLNETSASSSGTDEFNLVSGALTTLNALRLVTVDLSGTLISFGVPGPIAYGVHSVVAITMGMFFIQVLRGMDFG